MAHPASEPPLAAKPGIASNNGTPISESNVLGDSVGAPTETPSSTSPREEASITKESLTLAQYQAEYNKQLPGLKRSREATILYNNLHAVTKLQPLCPEYGVFIANASQGNTSGPVLAGYLNLYNSHQVSQVWTAWSDELATLYEHQKSLFNGTVSVNSKFEMKVFLKTLHENIIKVADIERAEEPDFDTFSLESHPKHWRSLLVVRYVHRASAALARHCASTPGFPTILSGAGPGRTAEFIYEGSLNWCTEDICRMVLIWSLYRFKAGQGHCFEKESCGLPMLLVLPIFLDKSPNPNKTGRLTAKAAASRALVPKVSSSGSYSCSQKAQGLSHPGLEVDQEDEEQDPHVKREDSSDNLFVSGGTGNSQEQNPEQARDEGHTSTQDTFAGGHKADDRIPSFPVHEPSNQGAGGASAALLPSNARGISAGKSQIQEGMSEPANEETFPSSADLARFSRAVSIPATASGKRPAESAEHKASDATPTSMPNNGFIGGPPKKYAADGSRNLHKPGQPRTLQPSPSTPATPTDVAQHLAQLSDHVLREQAIRAPTTNEPAHFQSDTAHPTVNRQPSSLGLGPVENRANLKRKFQEVQAAESTAKQAFQAVKMRYEEKVKLRKEKDAKLKAKCDEREAEVKRLEEETRKYQELDEAMDDESDEEV
ncbi:hypothetical protein LTR56_024069 [Elasticomyces elasticus]|nr:hypothetical protein LTR56_024069 [Elasticomyces elasticus]KAK3666630.1 hypothetical protein LTR22_002578 [Elasticomyces elasticus]KAK4921677.1 hypothetical protein LTR49_010964 [Elasticomyces elasticus]KAK5758621.1 hypothetical protein LTS12_011321 [Elasticomyces elasticus]